MTVDVTRPVLVGLVGGLAAFGFALWAHASGVGGGMGPTTAIMSGGSFALTVGLGLFVTLTVFFDDE